MMTTILRNEATVQAAVSALAADVAAMWGAPHPSETKVRAAEREAAQRALRLLLDAVAESWCGDLETLVGEVRLPMADRDPYERGADLWAQALERK